jgi:hypothetical protein
MLLQDSRRIGITAWMFWNMCSTEIILENWWDVKTYYFSDNGETTLEIASPIVRDEIGIVIVASIFAALTPKKN